MKVYVEKINESFEWDHELSNHQASLFLTEGWLRSISSEQKIPIFLNFFYEGEVVALISGLEIYSKKKDIKILFFYSSIVSHKSDIELLTSCKEALIDYSRRNSFLRIYIRSYDSKSCSPVKSKHLIIQKRIEYLIKLNKDGEGLLESFSKNSRRVARKARDGGSIIRKSNDVQLLDKLFEQIDETCKTRISKGYGTYCSMYFPFLDQNSMETLLNSGNASIFYVEYQGEILSIEFVVHSHQKSYSLLLGTTKKGYQMGTPTLIHFGTAEILSKLNYEYYNLGGIPAGSENEGLKRFKESLGTEIHTAYEEKSNFLYFPYSILNPLLIIRGILPRNKIGKFFINLISKFLNLIVREKFLLSV